MFPHQATEQSAAALALTRGLDDAKRRARKFKGDLEFRTKVTFWLVVAAMAAAIAIALTVGQDLFNAHFHVVDKQLLNAAGAPLAVFLMSLVTAGMAFLNVFLPGKRTIKIDVPKAVGPWLPAVSAIAVGILIGTTIFR